VLIIVVDFENSFTILITTVIEPSVTRDSIRGNHIVVTRHLCKRRYLYYELISDRTINFDQILVELNHREQAIRDSVIMSLMSRHTPSQPKSLPSTEEFAQRLKYFFLQVLGKMISNVDLAVDFLNVNRLAWVDLVEEPEVLDSHMSSVSSHFLGLGERQCTGVVFEDSIFGSG
jgi:hypothetical protein